MEPAFRCFPGQGEFDLPGFLAPILQAGYRGPLSLEIFNDGFRAAPPRANAADGLRSLLYLEEKTRQLLERTAPLADPELLFAPPPASSCDGIEFSSLRSTTPRAPSWATGSKAWALPVPASIVRRM